MPSSSVPIGAASAGVAAAKCRPGPTPDVEREGQQRLAARGRLGEANLKMPAGIDVDRQPVPGDDQEALDRGIADAGFRILGDHHAGVEIGSGIELGMSRHRQHGKIDLRLGELQHRPGLDHDRRHRLLLPVADTFGDMLRQRRGGAAKEVAEQFARPVQSGKNRVARALDLLEQHRARTAFELRRDARQLMRRIDLGTHAYQPSLAVEPVDDGAQVGNLSRAGLFPGHAPPPMSPCFMNPSVRCRRRVGQRSARAGCPAQYTGYIDFGTDAGT
jgi:hypothetical protein